VSQGFQPRGDGLGAAARRASGVDDSYAHRIFLISGTVKALSVSG
jgi:hypothetical protein